MLKAIKLFFEEQMSVAVEQDIEHSLRLATAALMIEMMLDDGTVHDAEVNMLIEKLQQTFALDIKETTELYNLAQAEVKEAVDYHQFTSLIAKNFSQAQKIQVIENLWAIAYADNKLDQYEELMVRRIADLIYVSHSDFIKAKHKIINDS
ncbi:hypothetical protein MNBD_GAMMA23-1413 [hydrothermal vent metagenome]|uniref:Co-chaperone DjlA N-terminal domain-containing protein n=1 Tax=hydrothermal vent metagenome TaxID=652676 RepID=A0A3B1AZG8_9ZZZZ